MGTGADEMTKMRMSTRIPMATAALAAAFCGAGPVWSAQSGSQVASAHYRGYVSIDEALSERILVPRENDYSGFHLGSYIGDDQPQAFGLAQLLGTYSETGT